MRGLDIMRGFIVTLLILMTLPLVSAATDWESVCTHINLTATECDEWIDDFEDMTQDIAEDQIDDFKDDDLEVWLNDTGYQHNLTLNNLTYNITNNVSNWHNASLTHYNKTETNYMLLQINSTLRTLITSTDSKLSSYALKSGEVGVVQGQINKELSDNGSITNRINLLISEDPGMSEGWKFMVVMNLILLLVLIGLMVKFLM